MRAPAFWWTDRPTLTARLLQPAGALYGALTARRMARPGTVLPVPLLCVGNLVAGGAGKTPTALALASLLIARGHRPAFLSRGYGRVIASGEKMRVLRVDPDRHDARLAGDEPLLLAALAPTFVSTDRRAAAEMAVAAGATILLMDDGLQNPALAKSLGIAVVDGEAGLGNRLCVPAGPLRAPVARQWPCVGALCVIGDGRRGAEVAAEAAHIGLPVLRARLRPSPGSLVALQGTPLLAFAGIGRPAKFFATLEACGLAVVERRSFGDHHRFTAAECEALTAAASRLGARLVTTAKDRTRLPRDFPALVLPVELEFDDPGSAGALLARWPPPPI